VFLAVAISVDLWPTSKLRRLSVIAGALRREIPQVGGFGAWRRWRACSAGVAAGAI